MYIARQPAAAAFTKCSFLAAIIPLADKPIPQAGGYPTYHASRSYATHVDTSQSSAAAHTWPTKPNSQLSPYEIFGQPSASNYQKTTFYHLVKLYHPDVAPPPNHPCGLLSKAVRIERFRLIVAANAILADPEKKKAYDKYGIGWNVNRADARDVRRTSTDVYADGPWKHSPAGNATWEDWERWYKAEGMRGSSENANNAKPWTSHTNFVMIIMLISFTGILIQLARVDNFSSKYEEHRDKRDRDISRTLYKLKREQAELGGKDGRVQAFLKMRDPDAYGGAAEVREERMQRLLPQGEVCMSDDTRSGDID